MCFECIMHRLVKSKATLGVQGQEAAVGGVAQGVRQSPRLISGAAAKEGNLEFPRKAFLSGGFMCPSPKYLCHVTPSLTGALYVTGRFMCPAITNHHVNLIVNSVSEF